MKCLHLWHVLHHTVQDGRKKGNTFLEPLDTSDPGAPPHRENHLVPHGPDLAERSGRSSWGRWSGNDLAEEIWGDSGTQVEDSFVFFVPLFSGVEMTQWGGRWEETGHRDSNKGQASYPPPDLKEGKQRHSFDADIISMQLMFGIS